MGPVPLNRSLFCLLFWEITHPAGLLLLPYMSSTGFNICPLSSHCSFSMVKKASSMFQFPSGATTTFAEHQDTWPRQSTFDSGFHKVTPKSLSCRKKNPTMSNLLTPALQQSSSEQLLLLWSVVRAEMPPPISMCDSTGSSKGGDRQIERNETILDPSEVQIIFHFLLILRIILLHLGQKAAKK